MSKDQIQTARIRPAARLISTIGEDLVGDSYAAIVELVKNSYDADATFVDITFKYDNDQSLTIEINDDGHGMTQETVLNKWLVPATVDKLERKKSPKGRLFQGRKGIGRYAAAVLGQEMIMSTTDEEGWLTEILIDWSLFEKEDYLDDIELVVNRKKTSNSSGTSILVNAEEEKYTQWGRSELSSLTKELRKLKSPFNYNEGDKFEINLSFIDCPYPEYNDQTFEIEAFPIIELFDYRIHGKISKDGKISGTYENNVLGKIHRINFEKKVEFNSNERNNGPIDFDFRVFDRDPEGIDNLIDKGLIDPISKQAVGKNDAKRLLNEVYGVNLYREGFRIRPYGNGGIDWLNLDKDRIQNPTVRISNNQIVGFVNIKPEEISRLEEKSARDGLKENSYYFGLVKALKTALSELEEKRFIFRKKQNKGRGKKSIQNDLNELFDYSGLDKRIRRKLVKTNLKKDEITEVANIIQKEAEKKSKLLEEIKNTIAIYQGQATLGKIITVLLHEGRKPVSYFKQQSSNLSLWLKNYKTIGDWDDDLYDMILERLNNFKEQSILLSDLFSRLDPLARQNKGSKKSFSISKSIEKCFSIFEGKMKKLQIKTAIDCPKDLKILGWEEDLIIALTNLIENSLHWLSDSSKETKEITVEVTKGDEILIHYKDNGPGIDKDLIESGAIFEPGFSKKYNGTGLGLPIAGEAIERLGGNITAHFTENGAYFTIELKIIED